MCSINYLYIKDIILSYIIKHIILFLKKNGVTVIQNCRHRYLGLLSNGCICNKLPPI